MQPRGSGGSAEQQVRVLPVLVGAMLFGVVAFAGVATWLAVSGSGPGGGAQPQGQANPSLLLLVLGLMMLPAVALYFAFGVLAKAQARRAWEQREDDEAGRAAIGQTLMTTTIMRAALAEGFGLFGAVLILIQGSMAAWGAVAICAVLLGALLPARARLQSLEEAATGMRGAGYGPRGA